MAPATAADRMAAIEASFATMSTENAALQAQVAALSTVSQNIHVNSSKEPKAADPQFYYGQRDKLASFITQVNMVLSSQPARYPTARSQIVFAGSFLRDTAFLWFQPHMDASTTDTPPSFFASYELFCDELRSTFGDPDQVATAERQLYTLRQRGSASTYGTEFARYAVLVKWNDEAKAAQFYRGLKDIIKDKIAEIGRPKAYQELYDMAIRIDTRLFERQIERGDRNPTQFAQPYRSYGRPPFSGNVKPVTSSWTKTESSVTRPNTQPFYRKNESLNAAFSGKPTTTLRGRLTPAEYQRRKDDNLCLYCGEAGHLVKVCPRSPPGRQQPMRFSSSKD